jgi:VanZ family protein
MKRRGLVSNWVPIIAWMVLIFAGSSDVLSAEHTSRFIVPFLHWLDPAMSAATIATVHMVIRKLGHFTEYAVLAALVWRGFRGSFSVSSAFLALCAFVVAAFYAASDEFHQSFVPTRTASARDVMIDCTGALFAVTVCVLLALRRRNAVGVTAR